MLKISLAINLNIPLFLQLPDLRLRIPDEHDVHRAVLTPYAHHVFSRPFRGGDDNERAIPIGQPALHAVSLAIEDEEVEPGRWMKVVDVVRLKLRYVKFRSDYY